MMRNARCGVDISIARDESFFISELDSQKEFKKGIFGGGLLVSDRMVEERIHAEQRKVKFEIGGGDKERRIYTFQLSEREKKIILTLNKQHGEKQ